MLYLLSQEVYSYEHVPPLNETSTTEIWVKGSAFRGILVARLNNLKCLRICSWSQGTSGLNSQYSSTELRQLDNHQPPQSSICTAQVELKCFSRTYTRQPLLVVIAQWQSTSYMPFPTTASISTFLYSTSCWWWRSWCVACGADWGFVWYSQLDLLCSIPSQCKALIM